MIRRTDGEVDAYREGYSRGLEDARKSRGALLPELDGECVRCDTLMAEAAARAALGGGV